MQNDFFLTTWFLEAMKWVYGNVNSVFLTILICTVVLKAITLFSDIKINIFRIFKYIIRPNIH